MALQYTGGNLARAFEVLRNDAQKHALLEYYSSLPPLSTRDVTNNVLLASILHVKSSIEQCRGFCLVCDQPHSVPLPSPGVCGQQQCNDQFQNDWGKSYGCNMFERCALHITAAIGGPPSRASETLRGRLRRSVWLVEEQYPELSAWGACTCVWASAMPH